MKLSPDHVGMTCEQCRRWPAEETRQRLEAFVDEHGRACGRAVPVAMCSRCAGELPEVAR